MKIYTFGYKKHKPNALLLKMQGLGATLIDVRFCATRGNPAWAQVELMGKCREFAVRYLYYKAWGNKHYNRDADILIVDFDAGLGRLKQLEVGGVKAAVLLCACECYATCHRAVLAERLRLEGYEVEELGL